MKVFCLFVIEINQNSVLPKSSKTAVRQRVPRGANGRVVALRKKPLTTIVAQLAGNLQLSQVVEETPVDIGLALETLKPPPSESVAFLSSHRLSGGEVSITDFSPDLSVIDRLKRLGTVVEVEDKGETNSLKMLEKMTKSVISTDGGSVLSSSTSSTKTTSLTTKLPSHDLSQVHMVQLPLQLTTPSEMPIITLTNVPSGQQAEPLIGPTTNGPPAQQVPTNPTVTTKNVPGNQYTNVPVNSHNSLSTADTSKVQTTTPSPKVQSISQVSGAQLSNEPVKSLPTSQDSPVVISFAQKTQLSRKLKQNKVSITKHYVKPKMQSPYRSPMKFTPSVVSSPYPISPNTALYISKDVTLIPKPPSEPVNDRFEPSLLEPVIDIVEEENFLAQNDKFVFKVDTIHNIDLPNEEKVFSCDICSAVYTHSNMLKKHYLRLHIARKYIPEKDMETFNIDPESSTPEASGQKLVFRCHTCRECFSSKNELRSHLTDHPPVDELAKQNKSHQTYKCDNCSTIFKWRKQFGRHKKACKSNTTPNITPEKLNLFHCLYCNETFVNANTKRNHILRDHPYVRRKHFCVFCKKDGFPTNVSLFQHLLSDHPSVYFACQQCKERFTHLDELNEHINRRHDQDDSLQASMTNRVSTIKQEKEFYSCDTCQRKFLIKTCFKDHKCFPEKIEKPKLQKIKKKLDRQEKHSHQIVDKETLFYSRVSINVRENLTHHLDGKIYKDDSPEEDQLADQSQNSRIFLNFSDGFPSSSGLLLNECGPDTPTRAKAPWEKYNFPKNYDGRCGLTSYIKDTAYLDISTQMIMRRNLQRLNMLPIRASTSNDVPSAVHLERLGAECAESYGQINKEHIGKEFKY